MRLYNCGCATLNLFVRRHIISLFVLRNRLSHYWFLCFWTLRNKPLISVFGYFCSFRLKWIFILLVIRWSLRSIKAEKWDTLPICANLLSLIRLKFPFIIILLPFVRNVCCLFFTLNPIVIITVLILWHVSNHYILHLKFIDLFLKYLVLCHLRLTKLKIHLVLVFSKYDVLTISWLQR